MHMTNFDVKKLKRNPDKFKNSFVKTDTITIVDQDLYVMFPSRYIKRELAFINTDYVRVLGIYVIIDKEDNYCIVRSPIFQEMKPTSVDSATVFNTDYCVLEFMKDDVFLLNNDLLVSDNFIYDVFDEFFIKGNIPWFLSYNDISKLFEDGKKYCNTTIGDDPIIFEILSSVISRCKLDKTIYFRQDTKSGIDYVGLNDIRYGFNNTGARLIGGYFKDGIVSAIVDPEKQTTKTSEILRK